MPIKGPHSRWTVPLHTLTSASMAALLSLPASASIVSDWNETALAEVRLARQGQAVKLAYRGLDLRLMQKEMLIYSD